MSRRGAVVGVMMTVALTLSACGGGGGSSDSGSLKIGALFPKTGELATLGKVSLDGAQLAVEMTNAQGGVNGRKVQLVSGDASSASTAVSEATRLTTKEGLKVVIGTYASDLSKAASAAAIRNGAFYWETDAISDELTSRGLDNFFQFPYTASQNGANAADMVKDLVAPKIGHTPSVVVVHNDTSYGSLVASGAEKQAKANGLEVLGNFSYPTDTNDQTALALKIKRAAPDTVLAASYQNDAVLLQRALRQQDVNLAAFVGTGGIYGLPAFADALGDSVNGILDTEGSADIPDKALKPDARKLRRDFVEKWADEHNGDRPSFLPTIAFDATWVLLHQVVAKSDSDSPEDLAKAANNIDLPEGSTILGYGVKFDDHGLNQRSSVIGDQWQRNKLVVVYPDKFANGEPILIPLPGYTG